MTSRRLPTTPRWRRTKRFLATPRLVLLAATNTQGGTVTVMETNSTSENGMGGYTKVLRGLKGFSLLMTACPVIGHMQQATVDGYCPFGRRLETSWSAVSPAQGALGGMEWLLSYLRCSARGRQYPNHECYGNEYMQTLNGHVRSRRDQINSDASS